VTVTARRLLFVVFAGIAVFAAFSIYADVSELADRLRGFQWWAMGAAVALALVNYALRYVRWSLYLRTCEIEVPTKVSVLTFLSGFALSVTPGKVGELIKSYLLRESCQVPLTRSAPVVVAERVTDLLALLILGIAGVAAYGVARDMVVVGAVILAAGLLVIATPRLAHGAIRVICAPRFLRKFAGRLRSFYDGLAELLRPVRLTWATALGVVAWLAECIGFALIVSAFPGTDVPVGLATLIYAVTTIAGALSFLPGGLLVTEATMTLFLVQASRGVDQATAVAATILTRLATLWLAVLIGLIALAVLRRTAPATARALEE
jgi:glycosyltransferase 2 family protein